MEVVKVDFALRLEPVYMPEETKGKHGARFRPGGRQPLVMKELNPTVLGWHHTLIATIAILDPNLLRAQRVENREVDGIGGNWTWARDVVAYLVECAQVEESLLLEELPIPLLRGVTSVVSKQDERGCVTSIKWRRCSTWRVRMHCLQHRPGK